MKTTHTPGPWTLKPYRKDFSIGISGQSEYVVTVTGMSEKDQANARLIAAAPELLEACKSMLAHFPKDRSIADIRRTAQAAIAKAEGRS